MAIIVLAFGNIAFFGELRKEKQATFVSTTTQVQPDRLCDGLEMNTDHKSAFAFGEVCGR